MSRPTIATLIVSFAVLGQSPVVVADPGPDVVGEAKLTDGDSVSGIASFSQGKLQLGGQAIAFEDLKSLSLKPESTVAAAAPSKGATAGKLPAPWQSRDVGRLIEPGRTSWDSGAFTLMVSPPHPHEDFSSFRMAYQPIKDGDVEVVARVVEIENPDKDSRAGVIICSEPHPEAAKAMLTVSAEHGAYLRTWGYKGGSTRGDRRAEIKPPYWVKLTRSDGLLRAYTSADGRRWKMFHEKHASKLRTGKVYAGPAAYVTETDRLSRVVIDNVRLNGEHDIALEPALPRLVLVDGSMIAAEIEQASGAAFKLAGRWSGTSVTTPLVARVEFLHPLPDDLAERANGDRRGMLLRGGDFADGELKSIGADGQLEMQSLLLGKLSRSITEDVDALVLRSVQAPRDDVKFVVDTQAGSSFQVRAIEVLEGGIRLDTRLLGALELRPEELRAIRRAD